MAAGERKPRPIGSKKGQFLLAASLQDPDARLGRRKLARLKAARREQESELPAEKRPRTQDQWLSEQRRATKLPSVGGGPDDGGGAARGARGATRRAEQRGAGKGKWAADEEPVGRKKAKRLKVLEAKKAKDAERKHAAERKATRQAAEAVKGKAKAGQLSAAASDLLRRCRRDPPNEQRLLASVAERVAGSPEKDLELFDVFFELHASGSDPRTKLLALLSAVAVFRDLVPGYRIREPSEQEKSTVRSKQVLALERSELALLQTYRRLLPALEAAMKREPAAVAPALAALVKAACDFNYRQRLLSTAVRHANSQIPSVREAMAEALQEVLEGDQRLEASKEVVLAIGHVAQGAAAGRGPGGLRHELLQVLLRLPVGRAEAAALHGDDPAGQAGADDELRRGLAEASISQGVEHLRKAEAELLYEVFVVYLRILRQRHIHTRELLASALVGLGKWGQQVNLELLLEILVELKQSVREAIAQADELVALQGLNCAMVLLSGPSQALITDATWLADALPQALGLALPSLHSAHSESTAWPPPRCFVLDSGRHQVSKKELAASLESESVPCLVLRCLDAAMRCPHGFGRASDSAMATLLEVLFLLAAAADPAVGLALLREAATLLRKHRRLHTLLDAEGGLFGLGGVTDRAVSVLWELLPLSASLAPASARAARGLAEAVRSRRALLADVFPEKDARAWLESELPHHLAALAEAPAPGSAPTSSKQRAAAAASFWSEAEVRGWASDGR